MLVLAPDSGGGEDALLRYLAAPLPEGQTRAVLARTNHELMLPLALALELGIPVRTTAKLLLEEPGLERLLLALDSDEAADAEPADAEPVLLRLAVLRNALDDGPRT